MRVKSDSARWLLWMSLLWGGAPFAGVGIAWLALHFGWLVIPAVGFFGALVAAGVAEVLHRRKREA